MRVYVFVCGVTNSQKEKELCYTHFLSVRLSTGYKGRNVINTDSISEVLISGVCHLDIDHIYNIPQILYIYPSTCGYNKEGGRWCKYIRLYIHLILLRRMNKTHLYSYPSRDGTRISQTGEPNYEE